MKKSKIVALCMAVALIVVGIVLAAVGWGMGAYKHIDKWSIHGPFVFDHDFEEMVQEDWGDGSEITALKVEAGAAEVTLSYGEKFEVTSTREFVTGEDFGKTVIRLSDSLNIGSNSGDKLHITLPKNHYLEELEVDLGAGSMNIDGIHTGTLDVDLGMGEVTMNGIVDGDINLDCGMGNIALNLQGALEQYHGEVDCAGGNVVINEKTYSGIADASFNAGGIYDLEIDVAMGQVVVKFHEMGMIPESEVGKE